MNLLRHILCMALLLLASTMIGGCGGSTTVVEAPEQHIETTGTLGQQLIDLHNAYKVSGAIDQEQYEELKESLLERYE